MAAVYPAGPLPTMMTSCTDSLLILPFVNVLVWAVTLSAKRPQPAPYS
jgi:hypothetical protein